MAMPERNAIMAKNTKQTSPRVAKIASKQLSSPRTPAKTKTVDGSALSQAGGKKKK
jgi:hypothetical protein